MDFTGFKVKVRSYTAWYLVVGTVKSALDTLHPLADLFHSNTNSTFLGNIQPLFIHISTQCGVNEIAQTYEPGSS